MYGSVLKVDSTKKVCKKLQWASAETTKWVTSDGNERDISGYWFSKAVYAEANGSGSDEEAVLGNK